MPSDDFNEFIDDAAQAIKRAVGPFSGLLNPQSTQRDKQRVEELQDQVKRQNRLLDTQLDAIAEAKRSQREAELERDALREQMDKPAARTTVEGKLQRIAELVDAADTDKSRVGSDLLASHYHKFWVEVQDVVRGT